jgi:NADPH-dependent curcumin reductase CurA
MHRSWRLKQRPGPRFPVPDDFEFTEVPLGLEPKEGEVLIRNLFLSVDPYMRWRMNDAQSYAPPVTLGDVMVGTTVAEVLWSRDSGFRAGDRVVAQGGWQSHACVPAALLRREADDGTSLTTALGVLGSPGFTAWVGLRHIGKPQAGETLLVGAATGPVGSMVGQLAQAAGARAVAICGGPEKVALACKMFGFDAAVDHQASDFESRLAEACPKGIDVYFENIGGKVLRAVRPLLNDFARIPVCGLAAQYNTPGENENLAEFMQDILVKRLTWRGFIVSDFQREFSDFLAEVTPLVTDGRISFVEDIRKGLEQAPQALIDVLSGRNRGKMVIDLT